VESCPISGTIARGADALADAAAIRQLLNSTKDESELTMCTDVDRNDKSRICEPGTVRVIGRRQIELYSKLIHTVDHVEGRLARGYDAIDAFLAHMWEVTVTGAPKLWAMRFIEQHERSPRTWYGGAIGSFSLNGNANMGLTLRTVRVKDGVAEIRAGGTLLIDSDPQAEERETELKAAAFLEALRPRETAQERPTAAPARAGEGHQILLIDHEDSFVHTLANYFRQTGAEVVTIRAPLPRAELQRQVDEHRPDVLVLSPGPGKPSDFRVADTIDVALESGVAVFGVCLGLQGIVEYFGGKLGLLGYPMHGKASEIRVLGGALLRGLPDTFRAGRYHSIFAVRDRMPPVLKVTAETDDGVVMAIEHVNLPVAAVQFHPESIMTAQGAVGLTLVHNAVAHLCGTRMLVAERS
jgi:anthranilate synthase